MTTPSLDHQREYWKYWQSTRTESIYATERANSILEVLPALGLDQPRILDLGCGTGWFTVQLAELGTATGLDLNDEAMREAQARWPHIRFIGGDICAQELEAGSYDLIVSVQVIAHVTDQERFMERVAALLAPGGYFLITTNNRFIMERLGTSDGGSHVSQGHIENWLSTGELKKLVLRYLDVVKVWTVTPEGNAGILRLVNSTKVNRIAGAIVSKNTLRRVKERLGLGYTVLLLARKPSF